MKLYEIPEAFRSVSDAIDDGGGELTPELEGRLDEISATASSKIDSIVGLISESERFADAADSEAKRLKALSASAKRKAEHFKTYLLAFLDQMGVASYGDGLFRVSACQNPTPSIECVTLNPSEQFVRTKIEINREAVQDFYRQYGVMPEGFVARTGRHLRIR